MGENRIERIAHLIKKEVAEMLIREVKDPRIGMVTITGVTVSKDLKIAHIYYSAFGSEKQLQDSAIGLRQATKFIQREIGRRIRMRYTPVIDFQFDHSLEYGSHIDQILKDLSLPKEAEVPEKDAKDESEQPDQKD
ncbi:MAG: 30S ribosome-binding factor RbfA [Thermodesulfobacteriota bacterium]|jgi:ribosome-binding factor A|nr:MAG: 30S ribosome-binding factor RbfA [Thermodesulfobacteriota bacterium]